MGFFDSKKIFKTSQAVREAITKIDTLDYEERAIVMDALLDEMDGGGVSADELKRVVTELRAKKEISEIDKQKLLRLLQ